MAGIALLLLAVLSGITYAGLLPKEHKIILFFSSCILLSPLITIVLTILRLRLLNISSNRFRDWIQQSFINFMITTIVLALAGFCITKQKAILYQLFFVRFYFLIFIPVIGLSFATLTTLVFKRD